MIPTWELEGSLVLGDITTGLPFFIFVTSREEAVGYRDRPRLRIQNKDAQMIVAIDDPIEVVKGAALTGVSWNHLVRYIKVNQVLLLDLWNGHIDKFQYMYRQVPLDCDERPVPNR